MKVIETFTTLDKNYPLLKKEEREICFIGRSNVGKSSLLNHLLQDGRLAKVSNTPGKTKGIHFFRTDASLIFVDLPGYGFARVAGSLKDKWGEGSLDHYLETRPSLLLILLDIRRIPSAEDRQMILWASHHNKPILFVFTKADKLKKNELTTQLNENKKALEELLDSQEIPYCLYSIKNGSCRKELLQKIQKYL